MQRCCKRQRNFLFSHQRLPSLHFFTFTSDNTIRKNETYILKFKPNKSSQSNFGRVHRSRTTTQQSPHWLQWDAPHLPKTARSLSTISTRI